MTHQFPNQRYSANQSVQRFSGNNNNKPYQNQAMPGVNYGMNQRQAFNMNQNPRHQRFPQHMQDSYHGPNSNQFNMQMMPQGPVNHGQMTQGPAISNPGSQGTIVQHVMIPVPVHVDSNTPAHLLQPRIISTSGGPYGNMNQDQVQTAQNHSNFQGFFSVQQSTSQFNSYKSASEHSGYGSWDSNVVNDLSYYIGNDKRDKSQESRSGNEDIRQRSRSPDDYNSRSHYNVKDKEYRYNSEDHDHSRQDSYEESYERRHNIYDNQYNDDSYNNTDWKQENRYEHRRERSQSADRGRYSHYSKHSSADETECNRQPDNMGVWHNSGYDKHEQSNSYKQSENQGRYSRHDEFASSSDYDRHNIRRNISDRNSESQRSYSCVMEDCGSSGRQNFNRNEIIDFRKNEYEQIQRQIEQSEYRRKEEGFRTVEYQQSKRNFEPFKYEMSHTDCGRNDYMSDRNRDKTDVKFIDTRDDLRNVQLTVRNELDTNYFDDRSRQSDNQSDRYDTDDVDDRKRKHCFPSDQNYEKVARQEFSPVSDKSKTHNDIKIHVSEGGRWIENFSHDADQDKEIVVNVNVSERDLLDGTEMVSDNESVSGKEFDNVIHISRDTSPVSVDSNEPGCDGGRGYDTQHSPTHSLRSRHSDKSLESHVRNDANDKVGKSNTIQKNVEKTPHCQKLLIGNDPLKLPDLCPAYNRKGCSQNNCPLLHICRHFIIKQCKYGDVCTKSHDLFHVQSYRVIKELNPGFGSSNIMAEDIEKVLRDRIFIPLEPRNAPEDSETHEIVTASVSKVNKQRWEERYLDIDPSFDARNYGVDGFLANTSADVKLKKNCQKSKESVNKPNVENSKTNDKMKKIQTLKNKSKAKKTIKQKRKTKGAKTSESDVIMKPQNESSSAKSMETSSLSPISGDEDDWDKYEKYEAVSDDNLSDNKANDDEFDNVSSDESVEEIIHSRAIDSFPAPTPENIAVPIGMNDPLVFNRPLKNNPSSYVGPMNRPPPMFPITSNAPLFPILQQDHNAFVPPQSVAFPGGVPGVPTHLPPPELMKQVVQKLPMFSVQPPAQASNTFKNDTNPITVVREKSSKSEKSSKDPEMKETIKELWTFPHKGVINMSVIEFVTETETYKDEFIAEIVRILVTLELPYVTMKKLLAVIKDKIQVFVRSETDLRKILDMYPENFKVIENVDSDDESDSSDTKRLVQIKANIRLGFCEKHGFLPFAIGKCDCRALHICKFYFLNDCTNKLCKFGHKLKTEHNINVLKHQKLHRLTGEELLAFMADIDNRNKDTIPKICKYYIREKGCYKGDSTDFDSICHSLHLCSYVIKGKCMNRDCERSHSIFDKQPLSLLQKYGLDPHELGADKVLQMLGERAMLNTKDSISSNLNKFDGKRPTMSSNQADGTSNLVVQTPTRTMVTHYVKNYNNPSICKFYNNETGCRKKDWGSAGQCFFLHICQYYVSGDCKFGEKCKRSHDFYSGQAAEILEKFNFDLDSMSSQDILDRLNNISRAPKEVAPSFENVIDDALKHLKSENEAKSNAADDTGEVKDHPVEVETRVNVEKNYEFNLERERKQVFRRVDSRMSDNKNISEFGSCNVEDVIKHIMNQKQIKKEGEME